MTSAWKCQFTTQTEVFFGGDLLVGESPSRQTISSTVSTQCDLFRHSSDVQRFAQFDAWMAESGCGVLGRGSKPALSYLEWAFLTLQWFWTFCSWKIHDAKFGDASLASHKIRLCPHLIHGSVGPFESSNQTASRSVQLFFSEREQIRLSQRRLQDT